MNNADYIIQVTNRCKSFDKKQVVCNIKMHVKRGEIFGFLGPNGSGKTTTIRMLCGLLTPDSGQGHCLGYDIVKQSDEIKSHVGYMTQHFSLYKDLTVRENLEFIARLYGIKNSRQRVNETLEKLKISNKRARQLSGQLSGGWQQRLALAGAMIHDPELLLLDEPTAGVDPQARREFWDEIHRLSEEGITTLVSTHYMDEAERCMRLAYISFGHILTEGTEEEVVKRAGLHVWEIKGEKLKDVRQALETQSGVEQVTPFGNELHVVGHDVLALEKAITPYQKTYPCKKLEPTLEDVFINLVAQSTDENYGTN